MFWPKQKLTKGDLFRYYVRVAPFILPAIADRPLVMKRFPNGVTGKPFYQHRAPDVPKGVRVEPVPARARRPPHIIGGELLTLLYTTQLAAHLAGSVVLARRVAGARRLRGARSRSVARA